MNVFDFAFFGLCTLFVLLGGVATIASMNPIRGAMGLLVTIVGIAGMYLQLTAEFLAAVQVIVYAGAVVVLFLFVIMLLGPTASASGDKSSRLASWFGAGLFALVSAVALLLVRSSGSGPTAFPAKPPHLGTIEAIGGELFTTQLIPFELSGALLLIAVVGAVAVARGKQVDPTLLPAGAVPNEALAGDASALRDAKKIPPHAPPAKEGHS